MVATRIDLRILALVAAVGCSTAARPERPAARPAKVAAPTAPAADAKPNAELEKLMRTRMNTAYSQLVFYVLDSPNEVDFDSISKQAADLSAAIRDVRGIPVPQMVKTNESREVYTTYNDILQRAGDRFVQAVNAQDRPEMETVLQKIGKTCNDCHGFFRVDVKAGSDSR